MNQPMQTGRLYGPYFAASNSAEGFVSYFDDIFGHERMIKRYMIKGGPGTGKSSFMRHIAETAVAHGRCVEQYCCSSDPDSLDGIVIDGRIAFLDATAPHCEDMVLPGARDELIHLGAFWDGEALAASVEDIRRLSAKKSSAYGRAYRALAACGELYRSDRGLLGGCIRQEKLWRAVERLCERIPNGGGFASEPRLQEAVSMKGVVRLDSLERESDVLWWLDDEYGAAGFFLEAICQQAKEKQCAIQVAYDPVLPRVPTAVRFAESNICLTVGKPSEQLSCKETVRINLRRFLDKEALTAVKRELRSDRRLRAALLDKACDALKQAGQAHFALEQIYGAAMDFTAQSRFRTSFCQALF